MKTGILLAATLVAGTAYAERDRLDLMTQGAAKSNAGDHAGAIALYEQAYLTEPDPLLLPILASEYARAGLANDALHYYCQYLKVQPKGTQAAYATSQVIALRTQIGQPVAKDGVCDAPRPVRIDFVTPRKSKPGMSRREMAGIASVAVGVASLVASVAYGMEAKSVSDQIADHSANEPWPDDIGALEDRGQRYEDRSKLLLVAGGAALVTGGILYFTGRANRLSSEQAVITPTVSPGGAGISFARGF
jgi:tetratricopeptide (TPR) repeat protein